MLPRKSSITGLPGGALHASSTGTSAAASSSSRNPAASNSAARAAMSAEYEQALNVMNESTMLEACSLLLSESDDEDYSKLVALYGKCQAAFAVIERESEKMAQTFMPSLKSARGGRPVNHDMMMKHKHKIKPSTTVGKIPMRRTSLVGLRPKTGAAGAAAGNVAKRGLAATPLSRQHGSDDRLNKKPRVAGGTPNAMAETAAQAPPASVRNFLARLNHDDASAANKSRPPTTKPLSKPHPKLSGKPAAKQKPPAVATKQQSGTTEEEDEITTNTNKKRKKPPRGGNSNSPETRSSSRLRSHDHNKDQAPPPAESSEEEEESKPPDEESDEEASRESEEKEDMESEEESKEEPSNRRKTRSSSKKGKGSPTKNKKGPQQDDHGKEDDSNTTDARHGRVTRASARRRG